METFLQFVNPLLGTHLDGPVTILILVSFFAGALHVASPDHWLPASVWSWRRGWTSSRTSTFASLFLLNHLAIGLFMFTLFQAVVRLGFSSSDSNTVFGASIAIALLIWGVRIFRFFRLADEFETRSNELWNLAHILLFLGPAETLIPLLTRSVILGWNWQIPFVSFVAGTLISGVPGIVRARWSWNNPITFSNRWENARNPLQLLPAALGILAAFFAAGAA